MNYSLYFPQILLTPIGIVICYFLSELNTKAFCAAVNVRCLTACHLSSREHRPVEVPMSGSAGELSFEEGFEGWLHRKAGK